MIYRLTTLLVVALATTATSFAQNGTIISYEILEQNSVADMEQLIDDLGVPPTPLVEARFGVDIYKIVYNTVDVHGMPTIASGALAVPVGSLCKTPFAIYCHGTTAKRTGVPSHMSNEVTIGKLLSMKGVSVAMPDYLGLGESPGRHPYIHAASEATASIDMLKASRSLCDSLGVPHNSQIFPFGYSQGGHASLATHKAIQELNDPELKVTACAPMSGPYHVSGAQEQYMIGFEPYATPGYLPYVLFGYQEAYGNLYDEVSDVFESPYDTLLPPLFDGNTGMGFINSVCAPVPRDMIKDSVIDAYENDLQHPLRLALQDNDLINWMPEAPVLMPYCGMDEQVTGQNAVNAEANFEYLGVTSAESINVGPDLDHSGCVTLALLTGLSFFEDYTDYYNGMEVSATVTDASDGSANDGAIELAVESGFPTSFEWGNGSTGTTLSGVAVGDYTVTLTDDAGCESEQTFTVSTTNSVNSAKLGGITFVQDRHSDIVQINVPFAGENTFRMMDVRGATLRTGSFDDQTTLSLSECSAGTYLIQVETAFGTHVEKLIK